VRIYWKQTGDYPYGITAWQHLVFQGVDTIIGSVDWWHGNYDYYSNIILTNGNDNVRTHAYGQGGSLYGLGGDDELDGGGILIDGGDGNDTIHTNRGSATLIGGNGDDLIFVYSAGTVDGGAGTDTVSYREGSSPQYGVVIDLATGTISNQTTLISIENAFGGQANDILIGTAGANVLSGWLGDDTLRGGAGANSLSGGAGNDVLTGSAGDAAGDSYSSIENVMGSAYGDTITGNAGANALWGMAGNDVLTGGGGADRFVYTAVSDSPAAATARDSINDFSHAEGDRIDLSAIDADGNAGNGNTVFTFLGGGGFTGAGHEVRVVASGGVQTVLIDVNGDAVADMQIGVISGTGLVAGDFVL
jgi:Ca2+-binding RTX toxin-like protein